MSFMPNPGSLVRLTDGSIALVTRVTPSGGDDRVVILGRDVCIRQTPLIIAEIIHEPELRP